MTWAKLDDKFHSHPTTWMVGLEANGLFARAISYCADQLTDGFVPEQWVYAQVPATQKNRDAHGLTDKLTNAGLWEPVEGGWFIKDFLTYNPSREYVLAEREAARLRRHRGADKARERRANVGRTSGERREGVA